MREKDALLTHQDNNGRTDPHYQFTTIVSSLEVNPQEPPMAQSRVKLMRPWGIDLDYPGTACLSQWLQQGVDMSCGLRWSKAAVLLAIGKGPQI
eukprot:11555235-Ditylum_brightwellii.AAC.1